MKFFVLKKRTIFALFMVVVFIGVFCTTYFLVKPTSSPRYTHSIVIDAGHGGTDVKLEQYVFEL